MMDSVGDISGTTGQLIKQWRKNRKITQADLAAAVGISTKHLSFVECNKAQAGRGTLEKIIQSLEIPEIQANQLMAISGYSHLPSSGEAPAEHSFENDWLLDNMLNMYNPFPAFIHDKYLNFVKGNDTFQLILQYLPFTPCYFAGHINALLTVAHPLSMRPLINNWKAVFQQMYLRLEVQMKRDPADGNYARLLAELQSIPDVPELLKQNIDEEVLHGINTVETEFGDEHLSFTRITSSFQGPLTDGYSQHYHLVAFLPSDEGTASLSRELINNLNQSDIRDKIAERMKQRH